MSLGRNPFLIWAGLQSAAIGTAGRPVMRRDPFLIWSGPQSATVSPRTLKDKVAIPF